MASSAVEAVLRCFLHLALDARADALLDLKDVEIGLELVPAGSGASARAEHLEHLLLVPRA